jgi:hypothetical protein
MSTPLPHSPSELAPGSGPQSAGYVEGAGYIEGS